MPWPDRPARHQEPGRNATINGPEHYREAERLAGMAHRFTYGDGADPVVGAALAAEAQVHATLALTAAQADLMLVTAEANDIRMSIAQRWNPLIDPQD